MKGLLATAALLLASSPASAAPFDASAFAMRPLLYVQATGSSIAGVPFEVAVFVYRSGPTYLVRSGLGDVARSAVATPEALARLNAVLSEAHVGVQTGDCGQPEPDNIAQRTLAFHGLKGRHHQLTVGGFYAQDCPAEVVRIFDAVCVYLADVFGDASPYCVPPAGGS